MAKKKIILVNCHTGETFDALIDIEDYKEIIRIKDMGFIIAEESNWEIDVGKESITH